MKKKLFLIFILVGTIGFCQQKYSYIQTDYFYGNVLYTGPDATIFFQGQPQGAFVSYNVKNYGLKDWHETYNYPDAGISFLYQNYKSDVLGELYAILGHYNFYLRPRKKINQVILGIGFGLSYNTTPYHKVLNNKNTALSTAINSSTYFKLFYKRDYLIGNFGLTAGFKLAHASNANLKSPNSGVNIWGPSIGLNYNFQDKEDEIHFIPTTDTLKIKEPIKVNLAIRGGANESSIAGTGVKPFFVASAYIDKRISRKSAFQLGSELFLSPMSKDYYLIEASKPNANIEEPDSFSRISAFIGYELFINKLSLEAQVGYYIKYPVKLDGRVYESLGFKRYLNEKWFAALRVRVHGANAESAELGIGIRF